MSYKASNAEQPNMTTTNKAPSAGAKVTSNAPSMQEAPGAVDSGSLAAESEAFRQGNSSADMRPQEGQHHAAPGTAGGYSGGSMKNTAQSRANPAPSYVENQYYRDPNGPHGKNITEDNSIGTQDKSKNASFTAEIGSKDDPSLLAEQKFTRGNSATAGSTAPREGGKVGDKTMFEGIGSQEA
ncbi:hypothetical protein GGS20DRAFT_536510 [Poronia punctata]|nr:hypothetical protein GGS20DRAFT_536510 [Poronia punctata]